MHNICKSALLSICEAHMIQYNFILELIKCKIVFLVLNLGIVGTFMILCLGPLSRSAHICESRFLLAQIPHFHQKKNQYMSGLVQVPCLFKIDPTYGHQKIYYIDCHWTSATNCFSGNVLWRPHNDSNAFVPVCSVQAHLHAQSVSLVPFQNGNVCSVLEVVGETTPNPSSL